MPVIRFDKVYKDFQDGGKTVHALKETSFEIEKGEFVAIIGPSGSGKSTLLTMMGGLQRPTGGSIALNDQDYGELDGEALTDFRFHEIGFILQSSNLVPYLTLEEQFRLVDRYAGRPYRRERAEYLMDRLGLSDRGSAYPSDMSGGERQRAAFCRALYPEPALILADEPTASLDSEKAFEVIEILADKAAEGKHAVVMVTHDLRLLAYVDRVFTVTDGVCEETTEEDAGKDKSPDGEEAAAK